MNGLQAEDFGQIYNRRLVLLSFLFTFLVGIPIWMGTTSIHKALEIHDMLNGQAAQSVERPLVTVPVCLVGQDEMPDLASLTQQALDAKLGELGISNWRLNIGDTCRPSHYCVRLAQGDGGLIGPTNSRDIDVDVYSKNSTLLSSTVASTLLEAFDQEIQMTSSKHHPMAIPYSKQVHVTFSLFVQDGSAVSWDIDAALRKYFAPLQKELSKITEMTIDTQIQFYSTLSVNPPKTRAGYILTIDDLTTFVNFAEWGLSSIHQYPTLNFILYLPSPQFSPLLIENSLSNSFAIPQWGGVYILNTEKTHLESTDLVRALDIFSSQLMALLGVPSGPPKILIRIDSLARVSALRALESAKETLGSLSRVARSMPGMSIPISVVSHAQTSLAAIAASMQALKSGQTTQGVADAAVAMENAHKAFFNKSMMARNFFPDEHKIAVYMPLMGPVCVVMLMCLTRLVREFRHVRPVDNDTNDQ